LYAIHSFITRYGIAYFKNLCCALLQKSRYLNQKDNYIIETYILNNIPYDIFNLIILVRRAFYFVPAACSFLLTEIRDFSRADQIAIN